MIKWPNNKKFAFTIVDDTDCSTLENAPFVYDYLKECGLKTTKSVWIFNGEKRIDNNKIIGTTCEDERYLEWTKNLQKKGFEIALHSTSWSRSERTRIIKSLDLFKEYFGDDPSILIQHNDTIDCESIYWGENRISGFNKIIYRIMMAIKGSKRNIYHGDSIDSKYFWGDICKNRIKYVRNFIYEDINTLKICPSMPYFDPIRPFVNYWFASTEAPDVYTFNNCISEINQKKLEEEGGACIIYTHFGKDFYKKGVLNPLFKTLIKSLSKREGWFVTASELLDYLLATKNKEISISNLERDELEKRWLYHKIKVGTS